MGLVKGVPPARLSKEALAFALRLIKARIDEEGLYVPDAGYELSGRQLREFLAFAFDNGRLLWFSATAARAQGKRGRAARKEARRSVKSSATGAAKEGAAS